MHYSRYMLMPFLVGCSIANVMSQAQADERFPNQPIKIVVGAAPGGLVDLATRKVAEIARASLNDVPIIIENKLGAMGTIALQQVLGSKPDGYTLASISTSPVLIAPLTSKNVKYDALKDVRYLVNLVGPSQALLVRADSKYKTLEDLVEDAKARPGEITYATYGASDAGGFGVQVMGKQLGAVFNKIPYQGSAQQVMALLSGEVQFTVTSNYMNEVRNGRIRPLALLDKQRFEPIADVPTFKDLGVDFEFPWITGLAMSPKVSEDRVKTLEAAFLKAAKSEEFKAFMKERDVPLYVLSSAETRKQMEAYFQDFTEIVKEFGEQ